MPLLGCQAVSSGPLIAFQLACVTLPLKGLFVPSLQQVDWWWEARDKEGGTLIRNLAVILEARSVASVFIGRNAGNRITRNYKWIKTTASSFQVFNQVTLSVTGLNMRDVSHNTPSHLFFDLALGAGDMVNSSPHSFSPADPSPILGLQETAVKCKYIYQAFNKFKSKLRT